MLDSGLEPPGETTSDPAKWRDWFDEVRPRLTELHLAKIREALDRVRLFRVVELTE
jgi:hypothetical protein